MNITWGILSKYKNELYGFSIIWIILFHGLELRRASLGKALDIFKGVNRSERVKYNEKSKKIL